MFRLLPFIGFVVLVYAALVFLGPVLIDATFTMPAFIAKNIYVLTLPSKENWSFTVGDAFVVVGLLMLGIEGMKSTQTGTVSMGNHVLSLLVFVGALLLFLLVKGFATTTFFLLTMMALIDSIVGMLTSIVTARSREFRKAAHPEVATQRRWVALEG
jgi:hypothetical protein